MPDARRGRIPPRGPDRPAQARLQGHARRLGVRFISAGHSYGPVRDLFTHLLAFWPGFIGPSTPRGEPRVCMSHGVDEHVLPIDPCGRRIAAQLRAAGFPLHYGEFAGGHLIPPGSAEPAQDWFVKT